MWKIYYKNRTYIKETREQLRRITRGYIDDQIYKKNLFDKHESYMIDLRRRRQFCWNKRKHLRPNVMILYNSIVWHMQ